LVGGLVPMIGTILLNTSLHMCSEPVASWFEQSLAA
jgi:hypothetical protein